MTATPNTAALQALLERVEAGEFYRDEMLPPKVNALTNAFEAAGMRTSFLAIAAMLKAGTVADHIRALIATADTEGR